MKNYEGKYWISGNSTVRCASNTCPVECNMGCPIYLQTLAIEKYSGDELTEAVKLLKKALEIEPMFGDAWNNLAACYGQMGDHVSAYKCYQNAYELSAKSNALYGMALAAKNMRDYSLSMKYAKEYAAKFGANERISSLIAELMEKDLEGKIERKTAQETKPASDQADNQNRKGNSTNQDSATDSKDAASGADDSQSNQHIITIDDMEQYGKLYLQLLNPAAREAAYAEMIKMEPYFPEAGVALGQYYNGQGDYKAKLHFKRAADAQIHEGEWSYANMLKHSYIPDRNIPEDAEYEDYCLRAAEGGSPDAANEVGNICNRRGCIAEAAYWYALAYFFEQPQAAQSVNGIVQKWISAEKIEEFKAGTSHYTETRHKAAICFLKTMTGENMLDDLMVLNLGGDTLAGLTAAFVYKTAKNNELTYQAYNILAFENHPHVLRCYADMLLAGRGTRRDVENAMRIYEKAAKDGNAPAMYAMGQKAVREGNRYLAACWFGQAYARGMEQAGEWLVKISK